ncbi:MAG: glycosyltransferase family 39 protein [Chloroflexota bacterium]
MSHLRFSKPTTILVAIIAFSAFLRFYRIDQVPPGLRFDEAFNLMDILALMQGQFAIFFPANNGREPLFNYLSIVATTLFGAQPIALRVTAAIIGTATILLVYGFARALFSPSPAKRGRDGVGVGLLAAFLMAISVWHIYYSRYGLRVILALALTILTLWWFWNGLLRKHTRDFVLAGIFAALTAYTYLSGRLLPLVLIALTIAASALDRKNARAYLQGLIITGVVAFVLFIPLGAYFVAHPDDFLAHGTSLSIFDARVNHGDLVGTLQSNLGKIAGMFFVRGDFEDFRNVPNRPACDPLIGAFFVIGLLLLLRDLLAPKTDRTARLRAILIGVALLTFLASSALSDDPPNFTRTLPTLSVLLILPAWGAAAIWERVRATSARQIAAGAFAIVALASTALSFNDYFITFANLSSLYYAFDVRMYDVGNWINQNARANQIYLAPLWYQQGTVMLLTRNAPLKSFESRDTIVLPSRAQGKDALYAFPLEQANKAAKLGERLGALATREIVTGSTGEQLLIVYRVRAENLPNLQAPLSDLARGGDFLKPQKNAHIAWGDSIELLGYSIDAADAAKRNLEVTLFFHARKPMAEDHTFSVKVRDKKDRVWGQEDKWTGNNSYETTRWSAGDVIVERFYPGLNACAPAGEYRVSVEAYNPKTMQVLEIKGTRGNSAELGATRAEAASGNLYEHLDPEQPLDVEVAPQARLLGYTLTPNEARAGDPFSLSLFWRGVGDGKQTRRALIRLRDAAQRDFVLSDKGVTLPIDGRGLCAFFDFQMPRDAASGAASVWVNDIQIATVPIVK